MVDEQDPGRGDVGTGVCVARFSSREEAPTATSSRNSTLHAHQYTQSAVHSDLYSTITTMHHYKTYKNNNCTIITPHKSPYKCILLLQQQWIITHIVTHKDRLKKSPTNHLITQRQFPINQQTQWMITQHQWIISQNTSLLLFSYALFSWNNSVYSSKTTV